MRNISIRRMQNVIADMRAWVLCETCPTWARSLVLAMADTLESILCNREDK